MLRSAGIFCADGVQGAERVHVGTPAHIIDGNASDQFGSTVARSPVGIDDDDSLAGKVPQNGASNCMNERANRLGIVVGGQAHKNIHLANVDELAKKIVG